MPSLHFSCAPCKKDQDRGARFWVPPRDSSTESVVSTPLSSFVSFPALGCGRLAYNTGASVTQWLPLHGELPHSNIHFFSFQRPDAEKKQMLARTPSFRTHSCVPARWRHAWATRVWVCLIGLPTPPPPPNRVWTNKGNCPSPFGFQHGGSWLQPTQRRLNFPPATYGFDMVPSIFPPKHHPTKRNLTFKFPER